MKKITLLLAIICMAALTAPCGPYAPDAADTPTDSLNRIEGTDTAVSPDSSLSYMFVRPINASTVNETTFYLNEITTTQASQMKAMGKGNLDSALCDYESAVEAVVTCLSDTVCVLDPVGNLSGNANFIACLSQIIENADGTFFPGASILFMTSGGGGDGDDNGDGGDGNGGDGGDVGLLILSEACTDGSECVSGNCADGVCCDTSCDQPCEECSTGACAAVTEADDVSECSGSETCNAEGECKTKQGEACTNANDCITGFCKDDVCCDTECTEECFACNYEGTEGTCTATPNGQSDPPECAAPDFCMDGRNGFNGIHSKFIELPEGRCMRPEQL